MCIIVIEAKCSFSQLLFTHFYNNNCTCMYAYNKKSVKLNFKTQLKFLQGAAGKET